MLMLMSEDGRSRREADSGWHWLWQLVAAAPHPAPEPEPELWLPPLLCQPLFCSNCSSGIQPRLCVLFSAVLSESTSDPISLRHQSTGNFRCLWIKNRLILWLINNEPTQRYQLFMFYNVSVSHKRSTDHNLKLNLLCNSK